ncbi:peroxiredoxin family protein [Paludibacterium paludis]|uniref:Thioredoxin n=1 Tax=Paludibacterium paludis TaxID=1225769 RepID=A0A918U844_9NEIS|nr:TlpA disulfide reductase family protein [Paludibacterium paludis]GGY09816.1 thioredoxin [Paludibacterium paludis]
MKKILIAVVALIAIGLVGYTLWFDKPKAPDVELTSLTGQKTSLSALKGKMVLVNFWATSCPGCVEEMPEIKKMHEQYAARGLQTLAVAMSYDPPNYVEAFTRSQGLPFFVALDSDGKVAKAFGDIQLAPTTFLIDPQGHILKRYVGVMNFAEVRQLIEANLKG